MTAARASRNTMKDLSVGRRLRAARQASGLSLRNLASHVGVSASMLSQLENGKSQPSVATLHALVTELGLSLDQLFAAENPNGTRPPTEPPIHRSGERPVLVMHGGVSWERLTTTLGGFVDMHLVEYPPGGASSTDGRLARHDGTEFAYLMEGELTVSLGYDTYELYAGDSLSFDSTTPHLYANTGTSVARGVWFQIIGQSSTDETP